MNENIEKEILPNGHVKLTLGNYAVVAENKEQIIKIAENAIRQEINRRT